MMAEFYKNDSRYKSIGPIISKSFKKLKNKKSIPKNVCENQENILKAMVEKTPLY